MNNLAVSLVTKQIEKASLSHAYLLVGPQSYDSAIDITKIILGNDPILNERIDNQTYPDIITIRGSKTSIKKEDILHIQHEFSKTALEENPYRIYILEEVENSSIVAMNSLLKFLEEPQDNIVAILTTKNENKVLETIRSRCMVVSVGVQESISTILEKEGLPIEDTQLLSILFNKAEDALEYVESKEYLHLKETYYLLLSDLNKNKMELFAVHLQNAVNKDKIITRDNYGYLISLLIHNLSQSTHNYPFIEKLLASKNEVQPGFNLGNIVDGLIFNIYLGGSI